MPRGAPQRARGGVAAIAARIAAALLAAALAPASACELLVTEHRSGRELLRVPFAAAAPGDAPQLRLSFIHSVLGTPVHDRYRWEIGHGGRWLLVEEQFEGEGYGLPYAAAAGETLERHGSGWRLLLARPVEPLVVRPLPTQRMRLTLADGRSWLLADLATQALLLRAAGCALPAEEK
ncbi:MAG: DUF1850 domain-containing protein [Rubrivivax sp.]